MKQKKIIIIILAVIAVLICGWKLYKNFALSTLSVIPTFPKTAFTELSSLDFLDEHQKSSQPPYDFALGSLTPVESRAIAVKYDNRTYNVYAYVFASIEDAYTYYSNASGVTQPMVARGLYYLETDQLLDTKYCAYYENCAYRIESVGYNKFCKFMEWFSEKLPIDIREEFYKDFGQELPG